MWVGSLEDEYTRAETISERTNDESLFNYLYLLAVPLASRFQCQSHIEFDASSGCHLGHSMPMVDTVEYPLDDRLGM